MASTIDDFIADILTRHQRAEVVRMTRCGYSKTSAVRRLLRLGTLVRYIPDLEMDLIHGTNYALQSMDPGMTINQQSPAEKSDG